MSNAVTHAGEDLEITVRLDDHSSDRSIGLSVADNGRGMPDDLVKELGQPFPLIRSAYVRSNDQAAVSGTGLGLSIVYRLMEMNGGKITVSSIIGSGTDVTTWWPRS
ncbi:MAG: ATP-binding protein, partial [Rhodospirillales bacterium]